MILFEKQTTNGNLCHLSANDRFLQIKIPGTVPYQVAML